MDLGKEMKKLMKEEIIRFVKSLETKENKEKINNVIKFLEQGWKYEAIVNDLENSDVINGMKYLIRTLKRKYFSEEEEMKIHIIMCGSRKEAKEFQRENWMALGKMGLASSIDFNNSTINIADEIKLLHLTPLDSERLYGLKIEGFKVSGTFYTAENSHKIIAKLKSCERR